MKRKIKFNKNKSIGKVIYVVEGEKTEVLILKHIFSQVLPYTVIESKKDGTDVIHFKDDASKRNQIYVVVGKRPQVVGLERDQKYFEQTYTRLNYEFHLEPSEAAVYYLFDRDRDSNSVEIIKKLLTKLSNSRDNFDFDMNGALLISYPCIEAFLFNSQENESYHSNGKEIKKEIFNKEYFIDKLNEKDILFAVKTMLNIINKIRRKKFEEKELDNLQNLNIKVFDYEENAFLKNKLYRTLSLIGLSFLDLGIIEIENINHNKN